jgi:hypothetical protein
MRKGKYLTALCNHSSCLMLCGACSTNGKDRKFTENHILKIRMPDRPTGRSKRWGKDISKYCRTQVTSKMMAHGDCYCDVPQQCWNSRMCCESTECQSLRFLYEFRAVSADLRQTVCVCFGLYKKCVPPLPKCRTHSLSSAYCAQSNECGCISLQRNCLLILLLVIISAMATCFDPYSDHLQASSHIE